MDLSIERKYPRVERLQDFHTSHNLPTASPTEALRGQRLGREQQHGRNCHAVDPMTMTVCRQGSMHVQTVHDEMVPLARPGSFP